MPPHRRRSSVSMKSPRHGIWSCGGGRRNRETGNGKRETREQFRFVFRFPFPVFRLRDILFPSDDRLPPQVPAVFRRNAPLSEREHVLLLEEALEKRSLRLGRGASLPVGLHGLWCRSPLPGASPGRGG